MNIIILKLGLSFITLLLGSMVYIFLRPNESIYFIDFFNLNQLSLKMHDIPNWFYNISVGLHTYSMTILSSVFLKNTVKNSLFLAISWILINTFFELIQEPTLRNFIISETSTNKFFYLVVNLANGTFDLNDILFTFIGGLLAYFTLILFKKEI